MDASNSWNEAVIAFDDKNLELSLEKFGCVAQPSAVIYYNIGVLQCLLSQPKQAIKSFTNAVERDEHLSVGYFQRGCIHFEQKQYDKALSDFEKCRQLFRNGKVIDYTVLGLHVKLYICEVLYNTGLACGMGSNLGRGVQLILDAQQNKPKKQHSVIDSTVTTLEKYCTFSEFPIIKIPADVFRPTRSPTTKSSEDFLGKSKVIVSQETKITPTDPQVQSGPTEAAATPVPPPPNKPPPRKPASSPNLLRPNIPPPRLK